MDDGSDQAEALTLEPTGAGRSRHRRALWGVLAAATVAAGALVITSGGGDGPPSPGLPVALGAAQTGAESAAADRMLTWVAYVPGDDLPALGGEAPAYRLSAAVTEDQVRALADALGLDGAVVHEGPSWTVRDGAAILEVYAEGAASWWFSATGGARAESSGSSNGSAGCEAGDRCTAVTASAECATPAGTEECPTTECPADGGCAVAPTTTTVCGPGADCVEPSPPPDCTVSSDGSTSCVGVGEPGPAADRPSQDEARAVALDLLAAVGVDVDDAAVAVEDGYDAWHVTVEPRLDGVPSGLLASASVGPGGEVIAASGTLSDPARLGSYPLLDTRAAIDRANALIGVGGVPAIANETGDAGGTVPVDAGSTATVVDDAGGTADTTGSPCQVQDDGSEICEETLPGVACPQVTAPGDEPLGAPEALECTPPVSDPGLEPEPQPDGGPIEVVLVDAEPVLVVLGAVDGSTDAYLVPGYRFTDADGGRVDLPAVADSALTTPPTTDTSAIDPDEPPATEPPEPCAASPDGDADPDCVVREPPRLADGEEPQIGVGYYLDVDTQCGGGTFSFGGRVWRVDDDWVVEWSESLTPGERYEGGTFTLDSADHGRFVGDAAATKVAEFRPLGPAEDVFCTPASRG